MSLAKSRILVIDDHPIVVEGYRELINQQHDLEVCGVASTILEAVRKAKLTKPHLAVVDLILKDDNGLDLVSEFGKREPEMKTLVVSARDEHVFAQRALQAGAGGFLSKSETTSNLIEAIRDVLRGKPCASAGRTQPPSGNPIAGDQPNAAPIGRLADRELEAFELIGHGHSTQSIAAKMNISPKTVDRYRENIKEKLRLSTANQLLRSATIWVEENF